MTARAIAARSPPGVRPGPAQHHGLGLPGLGRVEQRGGAGDDPGLVQPDDPVPQRRPGAGQPALQRGGDGEQVLGAAAVLGQRVGELLGGELLARGRHPRRSFWRAARLGTAADQLGGRGELAGGHVGFQPVPRAQHPDQLIIAGAVVGVVRAGRRIGEQRQVRAARHHVQGQPAAERRRPAGRLAREPARRPRLPRAPAGPRRQRGQRPGRPRPGRRGRRPRLRLGGRPDRGDLRRRQLVLTRRRRPVRVGVLFRVERLSQVIQPGLALLLGHRIRPGDHRLPVRLGGVTGRHSPVRPRWRPGQVLVPPGVRRHRSWRHAPPPVRKKVPYRT